MIELVAILCQYRILLSRLSAARFELQEAAGRRSARRPRTIQRLTDA